MKHGRLLRTAEVVRSLMSRMPGRFSTELGLALEHGRSEEIFRWFLAALLYGARISGAIAVQTYHEFIRRGVVTPRRVLETGWDGLVELLDAGGYTRYDFKTATKLLEVMGNLASRYQGDLNNLYRAAADARDLEARLKGLGKGVGDVTVQIFLRELRDIWPKAQPPISPLAVLAAGHLKLLGGRSHSGTSGLQRLRLSWRGARLRHKTFADFESALVRLGRDYCRRKRWETCPMREFCGGPVR